ncbi:MULTISPECIES: hypothetical protein [unclassified Streptomyces]|uniref:hypothetical protein n=1 Tax=unclassified Streptomyces TaxID=2593676 RepID=UPI000FA58B1A|nr:MULTISPECIES: hypothetical protein [unclassified Streptomyces]MCX4769255.1 hypothetical protein [Streptomyces sp. NBC_01285]ROQ76592.1 hypothetical protein EDD95_3052 [Streptomyces sp. CEV 2-1]
MSAEFDVLACQVLDECRDSRLVCFRALVEVGKVECRCARLVATDSVLLKRAAQDPVSSLRKDKDVVVDAVCPLQLSAARGMSVDQVSEAIPVHDAYVVSPVAFPCGAHELLAVLAVRVGHGLAGEIAMYEDCDLAGEIRVPACAKLLGYLLAVLSDGPFAIDEHFARETDCLTTDS